MPDTGIKDLSLYRLDDGLAQLIQYRDERTTDMDDPPSEEELAAVDGQIREYLEALPRKVDGVAAIFRLWRGQLASIKAEADRLRKLAAHIEANDARLKEIVASVMEKMPLPAKGCRKLQGADGSQLMLKGNAGVQALEVNRALMPDEYLDVIVRMPLAVWKQVYENNSGAPIVDDISYMESNFRLREALAQKCPTCGGLGDKCPSGPSDAPMEICPACGGSGKQGVPGCSLKERGAHVEVR